MRKYAPSLYCVLVLLLTCVASGCAMRLNVQGQGMNSGETISGSIAADPDGSGQINFTTSKGATCSGLYVSVTRRSGEGTVTCSDGRSGFFRFASTGRRGTGVGQIGNEQFTAMFY